MLLFLLAEHKEVSSAYIAMYSGILILQSWVSLGLLKFLKSNIDNVFYKITKIVRAL